MAVLLILAACKVGQAVLEPVVFAIFIIEIAWPMQKTLKSKIGKATALALTVVVTATLALALLSVIVWGGRQVAEWVGGNLDRIQESLISSTAWLEEHDIFVFALLSDQILEKMICDLLAKTPTDYVKEPGGGSAKVTNGPVV